MKNWQWFWIVAVFSYKYQASGLPVILLVLPVF